MNIEITETKTYIEITEDEPGMVTVVETTIPQGSPAAAINFTATDKILGRSSAGAGTGEEIACTSAGRALLDDANATTQRATLGLGPTDSVSFGALSSLVPIISSNGNESPTADLCKGHLHLITATGTVSLPAYVSGMIGSVLTVYSTTDAAIYVDPDNDDRIILDGAAGGNGKKLTSASGAGDYITLICDSEDGWLVIGRSGTWTMES